MTAVETLLDCLPRTSLIVGKGGVGKTTCAAGLAASYAQRGERTLLVSTDPAAALASVLGASVGSVAATVHDLPKLDARQLAADSLRHEFLGRWRDTIADIVDRGTYLDRGDVEGLVDAALPGVDEIFALLALADLITDASGAYARIVVDTAPTGHTLRLLALPDTFLALLSMLDMMQDKHRFMVRALTHRYRPDAADDFLEDMRARIDGLRLALADVDELAALVVARDEAMVRAESARYIVRLRHLHIRVAAVIVNASTGRGRAALDESIPTYRIPRAATPPQGIPAVLRTLTSMDTSVRSRRATNRPNRDERRATNHELSLRQLTIVGGKGGVGKSTVACAIAIAAVDRDGRPTLLVSTDPAPSIADALGAGEADWARSDAEHEVSGVRGLTVRQMEASAAFARVRDEYQSRIDALFAALVGRGAGVEQDRGIVRDLLALAPPGIDELYALSILGDALAEGRFARIVVDPAPTGHLLRLLEMPAIALDWCHRLMRLLLKYRDIVGIGDTAEELLAFARRTTALDALLHDARRSTVMIVALDEPVVRAETERLATAVRGRGIEVSALAWNRVTHRPTPLPATVAAHQYFAEEVSPPPIGVAALREWSRSWTKLS